MSQNTLSFNKTQGNYQALPSITIDGKQNPPELMEDILQVIVEESLNLPAMFTLVIQNDYQSGKVNEKPWKHQDLLEMGKKVKIGFVASTTASQDFEENKEGNVIEGEITAFETHFSERTQAPIIIRGYDVSHRLHRGRWNRSFQNMTDSDIVKKIAEEVDIPIGKIDPSGGPYEYIFQSNQTSMEFLRERAARIGFELFVQDGKLYFRKPKSDKNVELKWLTDIHNFRVRLSSAEQVKEVEVRSWDYKEKRAIVSSRKTEELITKTDNGKGSDTSTKFFTKNPVSPTLYVVDRPVCSPKEADIMAQAICDEVGGQYILADAKGEGNPDIRPGRVVELKDLGKYSGQYYVTDTRHTFQERVYTTEFSVRGLRGGNLLNTLSPATHLTPGQTLLIGIVTDNEDPENLGRVKVKFPSLTEDHTSHWARVVSMGAGKERGFSCLPEVNDEVLVAFEHGDIHRPYILGGVWNGKDGTPNRVADDVTDGKVRLRTFQTRVGHKIQFVEEDKGGSKKGAYIETAEGHKLRINDSQKVVEIETQGGHRLRLDDSNGSITISSTGNLDINATGIITIRGSLIKLN
ncbi:VgrG-related protein [Oscillatoria sp. FACHB-1406]|uniref:VgrG-related protein n=1 Tax=Oscillatoria sp. FACHB-1406 TaxID=2692846 RepID=UPI00168357E0|nr:VgrG-related protein [Oscillatoria sp. FACHB-1406]MBD2576492.1 VgrG-related protein [Oscillatoria sp. FACHB-1406]